MNEDVIVTVFLVIEDVLGEVGHERHPLSGVSDAEVLFIGVVAALYSGITTNGPCASCWGWAMYLGG